jgi:hypothetical protein
VYAAVAAVCAQQWRQCVRSSGGSVYEDRRLASHFSLGNSHSASVFFARGSLSSATGPPSTALLYVLNEADCSESGEEGAHERGGRQARVVRRTVWCLGKGKGVLPCAHEYHRQQDKCSLHTGSHELQCAIKTRHAVLDLNFPARYATTRGMSEGARCGSLLNACH